VSPRAVGSIRRRGDFAALRRAPGRATAGPIRVSYAPRSAQPESPEPSPQVAYAISRQCGNAVRRNRLRRRLRAVVGAEAPSLAAGCYLVSAAPAAHDLSPTELHEALIRAMHGASARAEHASTRSAR